MSRTGWSTRTSIDFILFVSVNQFTVLMYTKPMTHIHLIRNVNSEYDLRNRRKMAVFHQHKLQKKEFSSDFYCDLPYP
jgi:hypothetical protein